MRFRQKGTGYNVMHLAVLQNSGPLKASSPHAPPHLPAPRGADGLFSWCGHVTALLVPAARVLVYLLSEPLYASLAASRSDKSTLHKTPVHLVARASATLSCATVADRMEAFLGDGMDCSMQVA
jgi:hypothetical protein